MSKRKVITQGRAIRQNSALGELVSKLPEYLFEAYRNDALFYSLVKRSAESCDNYTQFLEKVVEYYVRLKQAETEKAIDKAMNAPAPAMYIENTEIDGSVILDVKRP
jgi:hypothetical protein